VAHELRLASQVVLMWGFKGMTRAQALLDTLVVEKGDWSPDKNLAWIDVDEGLIHLVTPNTKRTNIESVDHQQVAQEELLPHDVIPLDSLGGAVLHAWIEMGRFFFHPKSSHLILNKMGKVQDPIRFSEVWKQVTKPVLKGIHRKTKAAERTKQWWQQWNLILAHFPTTSVDLRHLYASLAVMESPHHHTNYARFMDTGLDRMKKVYQVFPNMKRYKKKKDRGKVVEEYQKAYPAGQLSPFWVGEYSI